MVNPFFFQVYGLGQCCLDYVGSIPTYPPADVKCEVSYMVTQGGGPVATALVALARWGLSCGVAGLIGDDLFGTIIRASLDGEGVDTTGLVVREGSDSQFAFIVAEAASGRRTIFWRRPTGSPPKPDELDYSKIRNAKVIHTDGLFCEAALAACKAAKAAGVQVVVDAGSLREGMLELAGLSDYYLASESFAKALVGDDQALEACRRLAQYGPRVTGVTLGANGYVALKEGQIIQGPGYRAEAIDTTGCGDVFHAGFIYGVVQGWQVEKSLDLGAWAAARVACKPGGRAGIPRLDELVAKGYA